MTASDVHKTIREISDKYISGMPQLHLSNLADQMNLDKEVLQRHVHTLQTLGLVQYHDHEKEIFSLTESGKLANLP